MSKKHFSQLWKERAFTVAVLFVLSTITMFAQKVTGVVRDASGEPLVGVNVVEKGATSNGAVTNINGEYQINVATGKTLVFSYIGFESKEATVKGNKLNVYLKEDSKLISDVVVVGYGSMQRKDVTSSITTVKAEDLNKGVFTDPAQMLQGKVPGLVVTSTGDPNGSTTITLRGASTLRADAMSPYYVVDGIPGVDISMVAPDDIESIDVLRDASAAAIYGNKAANGVIIITTKKGKDGKTNVTYNGYVAFDNILKTLDMATADDLRAYGEKNGISFADDRGAAYGSTDWQDEVLRTGITHNHNLSINGGAKKTKYMASVNFQNREGVIKKSGMNRVNARSLITTSVLKDHLDISVGANAMFGKHTGVAMNNEGGSVLDAMNYFSPFVSPTDENGNWSVSKASGSKNYNPLSLLNEDTSEFSWRRIQFITKATLHIIDGLTWSANYSYNNRQHIGSEYHTRNSQLELPVVMSTRNGQATRNTSTGSDNTFETYGNFDKTFNDVHKFGLMLGYSWEERTSNDGFGVTVYNFPNDKLKWNNLTYANCIDGMNGVTSGNISTTKMISFYGRVNYSYNSRYMLQATIRRDGASVFGSNNRWGTFPSVSGAWNITEENFMKNQNVLTNLKLRVGYGVSGNSEGFNYDAALSTYGVVNHTGSNDKYADFDATKNPNKDLKWETTGMFNVGIDFAFLGGRINGTIEWYNKKTKDLLWNYPVSPLQYPYGYIWANVGDMTNRGIEFSINADIIQSKGFRWNTGFNISHNSNCVDRVSNDKYFTDEFNQGDPMVAGMSANGYTQRIIEGEALGTFYTYEYAGLNEDGKSCFYVHDAETGERTGETTIEPQTKDRTVTGCAQPKVTIGWNNTFTYKNWNATMFFTGVFGNKVYNGMRANYANGAQLNNGKNVLKEYLETPSTDNISNYPSDRFIENGSYLRLSTITLGYTFNNFNGWLNSLQLYATCNNVFTITSYKGLDPEVRLGGIDPGIDYRWSVYPHTRSILLGAKINF